MRTKQVIIIRKDLKMRTGKIASQAAHASMAALLQPDFKSDSIYEFESVISDRGAEETYLVTHGIDDATFHWLSNSFTKICVYVNSEEELLEIANRAQGDGVRNFLIKDNGTTEFNGVPTHTCLAIGPEEVSVVDKYTLGLKLL